MAEPVAHGKLFYGNAKYNSIVNSLHVVSLNIGLRARTSLCGKPNNRLVKWNLPFTAKLTSLVNLRGRSPFIFRGNEASWLTSLWIGRKRQC